MILDVKPPVPPEFRLQLSVEDMRRLYALALIGYEATRSISYAHPYSELAKVAASDLSSFSSRLQQMLFDRRDYWKEKK